MKDSRGDDERTMGPRSPRGGGGPRRGLRPGGRSAVAPTARRIPSTLCGTVLAALLAPLGAPHPAGATPAPASPPRVLVQEADSARPARGAAVTPGDTLPPAEIDDLLDEARDAQRHFESVRRRHLPASLSWGGGECDDVVGRMCWRHVTGDLWMPEPEDPVVVAAREELLDDLARVGERVPGDGWVLGQRVFYLLEAGRPGDARELAGRCGGAEPWWCLALEGYALHAQGRYVAAEEAYRTALEAMDPEQAFAWTAVGEVVDGHARGLLSDSAEAGAAARREVYDRLWTLADPYHLVVGNDRLTEHLARRTVAVIRADARNPHGITWGHDLEELLVRYGTEVGWERVPPGPGEMGRGSVVGHEHPESRSWMPPGWVLLDPAEVEPGGWVVNQAYAPSAYAPAYAPVSLPADGRVAVFPRGDRAAVVATVSLPADTTRRTRKDRRPAHEPPPAFAGAPARAGLFVVSTAGDTVRGTSLPLPEGGGPVTLVLDVPAEPSLVSVEVLDPVAGVGGRLRHGLPLTPAPRDLLAVSDLLLLEARGEEPGTLEEAVPHLRADDRVAPGDRLRVGWEVTGLGFRPETLRYRLSLREPEGGFLHRAGRWLGIVGDDDPLALGWDEAGPDEPGPVFRAVGLELPDVPAGDYLLRLELLTAGRGILVSERRLEVVTRR